MKTLFNIAVLVFALPVAGAALLALVGVGMARNSAPLLVAVGAVLIVILPALGLTSGVERKGPVFPLALGAWSMSLLVGFPVYFPGERADAIEGGLTMVAPWAGLPHGLPMAEVVQEVVPEVGGGRPPPPMAAAVAEQVPEARPLVNDAVVLPYEGDEHALRVPVVFDGPKGAFETNMVFDTGATFTTLDQGTLRRLGVSVPADAPEVTLRTASGERSATLVLIDEVWLGGMSVKGVTVAVCDECADDQGAGLLGLNVSGQFLVTVDAARRELVLEPRRGKVSRKVDIHPWVDVDGTATRYPDGRVEVEVRVKNRARLGLGAVEASVGCEQRYTARVGDIEARGEGSTVVSLPRGVRCESYALQLHAARWE